MIYLKYVGGAAITNPKFGEFKKGELKIIANEPALVEAAETMARTQPFFWRVIKKQTHVEKTIKNKLCKAQSYIEKTKIKGDEVNDSRKR